MQSIEHDELIRVITRNVPGAYVRDYRDKGGWLTICRGHKTIYDHSRGTDKFTSNVPAETLASFPRGQVTAANLMDGPRLARPGWRVEMRRLREFISDSQARRIERDLRMRVFT